jgi:hypothetical protein
MGRHETIAREHARKAGFEDPIIIENEELSKILESSSSAGSPADGAIDKIQSRIDELDEWAEEATSNLKRAKYKARAAGLTTALMYLREDGVTEAPEDDQSEDGRED